MYRRFGVSHTILKPISILLHWNNDADETERQSVWPLWKDLSEARQMWQLTMYKYPTYKCYSIQSL